MYESSKTSTVPVMCLPEELSELGTGTPSHGNIFRRFETKAVANIVAMMAVYKLLHPRHTKIRPGFFITQ